MSGMIEDAVVHWIRQLEGDALRRVCAAAMARLAQLDEPNAESERSLRMRTNGGRAEVYDFEQLLLSNLGEQAEEKKTEEPSGP